jgi:hypothetical protein
LTKPPVASPPIPGFAPVETRPYNGWLLVNALAFCRPYATLIV